MKRACGQRRARGCGGALGLEGRHSSRCTPDTLVTEIYVNKSASYVRTVLLSVVRMTVRGMIILTY
jgi:hypothetical protein